VCVLFWVDDGCVVLLSLLRFAVYTSLSVAYWQFKLSNYFYYCCNHSFYLVV
jgi:hypothetical protein